MAVLTLPDSYGQHNVTLKTSSSSSSGRNKEVKSVSDLMNQHEKKSVDISNNNNNNNNHHNVITDSNQLLRGEEIGDPQHANMSNNGKDKYLILTTSYGTIKIKFLPNLSESSYQHIEEIVATGKCDRCVFHRSEKHLLLQGTMKSNGVRIRPKLGDCPSEYQNKKQNCPEYDKDCACHGPTMTKGMVGWAGGGTGPDFFINVYDKPVDFWGQQHTVWGIAEDVASLELVEKKIGEEMKVFKAGGVWKLEEPIPFTMSIIE